MEELLQLKNLICAGDTTNALILIDEIEQMGKEDKINQIYGYCAILLTCLIKQYVEARITRSWQVSIDLAVDQIRRLNKRPKVAKNYLDQDEIKQLLAEAYLISIKQASLEVCEGIYTASILATMVDQEIILVHALSLIRIF